jgi:Excreted virulence factor EspC, type VII ESX diderm
MVVPAASGGQGFGVVADQVRALAGFFEDLEDAADGFADRVAGVSISGEQTGRCCREAGDTLRGGLQRLKASLDELGSRALDIRGALDATARNYDQTDAASAQNLAATGADL